MYVCMYVMYVMYVCNVCMYVFMYVCMCVCMYVMYVMYVLRMYMYINTYTYTDIYIHTYRDIYIHIYTEGVRGLVYAIFRSMELRRTTSQANMSEDRDTRPEIPRQTPLLPPHGLR
jgi:hypothetical protein